MGTALNVLVFVHELRGEFDQSIECIARMQEIAEEVSDSWTGAIARFCRAALAFDTGEWARAGADLARAIQMAPHYARDAYVVCLRGLLAMAQGAWAAAAADLEEAVDRAARRGDMHAQVWAERSLAELDLLQERPAAALARLRVVLDREERHDEAFMLPSVALAHLQLGEVAEAEAMSLQAIGRATAEGNQLALADALRVQVMVATRQGRWEEAECALEEGLSLARSMPYPYAEARLLHVYGEMHAAKGEPEPARERLEAALAIFRRLGARKDADRVEQVVAHLPGA